ncbi:MAG: AtpZ/AtpI family protein [Marmoricola sp.]
MGDPRAPSGMRGRDLASLGGALVAAVVGGLVVGLLVDNATGDSPTWTLVGIGVGIAFGILAFVLRVRAALRE